MDQLPKSRRSENMRRIRSKNTLPELAVRRIVSALGYRYRLHGERLPGKPDLVFAGRRKAIFVHGCFWHQHRGCIDSHLPKSNRAYWKPKLQRNKQRDVSNKRQLTRLGWRYLVLWECQVKKTEAVSKRVARFLTR